ncbi:MAG: PTS sugar transporter subunit IIA [Thermodesulfobacteriota bacterium]
MKIWTHLSPERIFLGAALADKNAVLQFIALTLGKSGAVKNSDAVYSAIKKREDMMSTGIGGGIGIPHALTPEVNDIEILLMRLETPIPFEALDKKPVDIVFALVVHENETTLHLRTLAGIAGLCKKQDFLKMVRSSDSVQAVLEEIKQIEEGGKVH